MAQFQRPHSVREAAYSHLRGAILTGSLLPGARISEPGLAQELGVSRTPVREALQRLAQEGLVELLPGKGARVRVLSAEEVREVYDVRALLEGEAAALAAQNATEAELDRLERLLQVLEALPKEAYAQQMQVDFDFHTALVEAAHNKTLARIYADLRSSLTLVRSFQQTQSQHPKTRQQHQAILAALKARNPVEAAEAARAHVRYFRDLVLQSLQAQAWQ
ncbi:GntR family transcriptional regulator [Meiothermus ruber]|jgi:DNA-binding GntR family transcriptional regulator|uniref:GntR family transcriptional regulator n=1 Tax=Meiothermus ruber (strain ATCC 35948 / DSM 1279 / VKM B-1258 / 21) TaxID=504728 RepID=D3PN64_MEIRD|nr:GntR family transcriptional regulator [Meiothermus ruber]GIW38747.1 MAG: GntR family transcriptional regulator [Meiothermus sp.]ADD29391.1 transcriptional regulator, GntR family [Meiothermus ruber DSM 1279]AGK05159.1 GntR family transcriptional regulator [Meiothermus ruber DSM 1279]MCL6530910.1 GntR family transcriptional regulator [Meiothermus ruber]GAO76312.1 GntR family transcriptional regulator [Meiothermus ruber H328]